MTRKAMIPPVVNDPVALARSLFPKEVDTDVKLEKGQPDSPTARQPDSPTARQPDSPGRSAEA